MWLSLILNSARHLPTYLLLESCLRPCQSQFCLLRGHDCFTKLYILTLRWALIHDLGHSKWNDPLDIYLPKATSSTSVNAPSAKLFIFLKLLVNLISFTASEPRLLFTKSEKFCVVVWCVIRFWWLIFPILKPVAWTCELGLEVFFLLDIHITFHESFEMGKFVQQAALPGSEQVWSLYYVMLCRGKEILGPTCGIVAADALWLEWYT